MTYLDPGEPCPYCGRPITWVDHLPGVNGRPVQCKRPLHPYAGFGQPAAIALHLTTATNVVPISSAPSFLPSAA